MEAYVNLEVSPEGIAHVEFFHPASNSLPSAILGQLAETIEACGKDDQIKVVVVKSGGERAFCAGASFDELMAIEVLFHQDPVKAVEALYKEGMLENEEALKHFQQNRILD